MKKTRAKRKVMVLTIAFAGLAGFLFIANAGDLEPIDPPGPTMKTLDEVEPRIPIPGSAVPEPAFIIDNQGSYYLTGDRIASGNGIEVNVDHVTIDLMGYSLIGPGSGTNYGVYMDNRRNVEICNGTVRDFGSHGIYEASRYGKEHRIIGVRAISNGDYGISLLRYNEGYGHLVKDCTAADNAGYGILAGSSSTVTGNTAYNNQGIGIYAYQGCTVSGNTASYNGGSAGIVGGSGCTVIGNTVRRNNGSGIAVNSGATVIGNTVYNNNTQDAASYGGIRVGSSSLVKDNTAWNNWQNNIYVYGGGNTIEENLVTDTVGNGIRVTVGGNLIIRNAARNNTNDYNIVAGNAYGQIKNVAGGGSFVNTDPTANFVF